MHSWWVMTPERCDHYVSPWSYEPPEWGRDVVVVHATSPSAAVRLAWRRPEMADHANEMRGDGKPPWHLLTAELADCRHGVLLGEDETGDCPWCTLEDGFSFAAEEEVVNDRWQRSA